MPPPLQNLGGAQFVLNVNAAPFNAAMAKAQQTAQQTATNITKSTQKASSGAAQSLLQLGYAIDDIQYGFRGIVNNIPQIVTAMGGGAGLAGGVAIAAVAINQLIEHWGTLMNAFQSQWLNVPIDRLEKLRMATEAAQEQFDKLMKTPKDIDARETKTLHDAIVEVGPREVMRKLREIVTVAPEELGKIRDTEDFRKQQANIDAIEAAHPGQRAVGPRKKMEDQIQKAIEDRVKEIEGGLLTPGDGGREARDAFRRLFRKYAVDFSDKLNKALFESSQLFLDAVQRNAERAANFVGPAFNLTHANQAAAAMMINSPIGREALMGGEGAGAARPPTEGEIRKRLTRREIFARTAENMTGVKPKPGQSLEWVHRVNPKEREQAADQLVKERMANPPPAAPKGKFDLHERMQRAMEAAGVPGDARGVVQDIQAMGRERVKQIVAETGKTQAQARAQMMRENIQHNLPGALPRGGQILDPVAFSRMAHELIQNGPKDPQLAAMQQAVGYLKQLVDAAKNPKPAVAVK